MQPPRPMSTSTLHLRDCALAQCHELAHLSITIVQCFAFHAYAHSQPVCQPVSCLQPYERAHIQLHGLWYCTLLRSVCACGDISRRMCNIRQIEFRPAQLYSPVQLFGFIRRSHVELYSLLVRTSTWYHTFTLYTYMLTRYIQTNSALAHIHEMLASCIRFARRFMAYLYI